MKNNFKLDEIERLKLEVFQLKLELIEKSIKEVLSKRDQILRNQLDFVKEIEYKYGIKLDAYDIDLINGFCSKR